MALRLPTGNIGLVGLPAELLGSIADFLEAESDINALAQTNRWLSCSLNWYLYRRNVQRGNSFALSFGADHGLVDIVEKTLRAGADVNVQYNTRSPVSLAAGNGHAHVAQLLLGTDGVDPELEDSEGRTACYRAAMNGYNSILKLFLADSRVDPDREDSRGRSPLHAVVDRGFLATTEILLGDPRVNPNRQDKEGWTPLMIASLAGHTKIIRRLLKDGRVNRELGNDFGTALAWAAHSGQYSAMEVLLEDGAETNPAGCMPMMLAALGGHKACVALLLSADAHRGIGGGCRMETLLQEETNREFDMVQYLLINGGVDPEWRASGGSTMLMLAAAHGWQDTVKAALMQENTPVNAKNGAGCTALAMAVNNNQVSVVKLLLEKQSIDVNCEDPVGRTPLTLAVIVGNPDIVKLLLMRRDLNVNSPDTSAVIPLSRAAWLGMDEVVLPLVADARVSVNGRDDKGRTPLIWAVLGGKWKAVRCLLVRPTLDVKATDAWGWSALTHAARCEVVVLRMLLQRLGIEVNVKDVYGRTPLAIAAWVGNSQNVQELVKDRRVDLNPVDLQGYTPYQLAVVKRHRKTREILENTARVSAAHPTKFTRPAPLAVEVSLEELHGPNRLNI